MEENTLVEVKHVSLNFGKEEVLKNIDLSVKSGEIIGFLGPSGAGKTTLVKAIVGMNLPNEGDISVFDEQMPSLKVSARYRVYGAGRRALRRFERDRQLDLFCIVIRYETRSCIKKSQ